jgi:hypothetical protein
LNKTKGLQNEFANLPSARAMDDVQLVNERINLLACLFVAEPEFTKFCCGPDGVVTSIENSEC